jgi:class I fructose-bisphosphate aldolase
MEGINLIGKKLRMNRIFQKDKRAVVVAADHGNVSDPAENIIYLEKILKNIIEASPDAILLTPGQAERLGYLFKGKDKPALIVRGDWMNLQRLGSLDVSNCLPALVLKRVPTLKAIDALLLGASAVTIYLFVGYDKKLQNENLDSCKKMAKDCKNLGLPCIIEPIAYGGLVTGKNIVELLQYSAKLARDAGADALKIPYTGDVESFRELVKIAKIPVLMLGGAKSERERDALELVEEGLEAGCSGVVFGRNVTKAKNPKEVVENIKKIVHYNMTTDQVFATYFKKGTKLKVNREKCTGCQYCEVICNYYHTQEFSRRFSSVKIEEDGNFNFKIRVCNLCGKCVKECPKNALYFSEEGYLQIDEKKCNGCKICVEVCHQKILKFEGKLIFCDMCKGNPLCVKWCPNGAIYLEVKK